MVELRKITKHNFEEVLALSVAAEQAPFIPRNVHSLAQACIYRETAYPFAVYAEDALVGFVMMGYYEKERQYTLWRLMIDQKHQGKGYGKAALRLAVQYMIEFYNVRMLGTGVHRDNLVAQRLYKAFGFRETGQVNGTEIGMRLLIEDFLARPCCCGTMDSGGGSVL